MFGVRSGSFAEKNCLSLFDFAGFNDSFDNFFAVLNWHALLLEVFGLADLRVEGAFVAVLLVLSDIWGFILFDDLATLVVELETFFVSFGGKLFLVDELRLLDGNS